MDLHRRIRTLRLRRGLTGMELARRAWVSPSYVSLIEHGEKIPSEEVAVRIARALGEREDVYRVWAATARMDEATRDAVWRLRGADAEAQRLPRGGAERAEGEPEESAPDGRRPPGRPRLAERYEFQVAYKLEDDERAPTLRVPLVAPGATPKDDPPPRDETEALVALDARLVDRSTAKGLVALRIDETNGRAVVSWLRPRDLVVVDRRPPAFDPALIHAFALPEGLRLHRAALAEDALWLLPDPQAAGAPRRVPLGGGQSFESVFFGTVIWSARIWPLG